MTTQRNATHLAHACRGNDRRGWRRIARKRERMNAKRELRSLLASEGF